MSSTAYIEASDGEKVIESGAEMLLVAFAGIRCALLAEVCRK